MTLEELLNKLIEKGWLPRGENNIKDMYVSKNTFKEDIVWVRGSKGGCTKRGGTFRELTSKESGLWQFVCENDMVKEDDGHIARIINLYKSDEAIVDGGWNYHYWLMICSILDETDLEEFLLDNIKIDE